MTGDEPPGEFRIFAAGANETTKGTFLFDDEAAASVMAEYQAHGIDLMLDYDHASLGAGIDPALSGKAAGWFNLEVRNGELWAVNVRWTPPAAEALRRKEWRFMSPAFSTNGEGRVSELLNVAITNLPATRRLEPLMAANRVQLGGCMLNAETVKKALEALASGDAEACMGILTEMIASAAAGETPAEEAVEPAALAEPPADPAADPAKDKPEEVMAATSKLLALSGKSSLVATLAEVETWRESHLTLSREREALAAREAVLEGAERRKLCVELVTLGGRAPATVWSDEKATAPKSYLASMPIAELRSMHADTIKANAGRVAIVPPAGNTASVDGGRLFATIHGNVTLSSREISDCEKAGAKLEVYAANKAFQIKSRPKAKE